MLPAFTKMTLVLVSPKNCKEFESRAGQSWAREIVVDYYTRTEDGWLLGPLVKMLSVIAKENPTPGGLSRSYCLEVFYKIGETMTQEHWFVKIPKSLQTVAMDERELVMYNTIFPRLQVYLSETLEDEIKVDLPIPIIYFSSFLGDGIHDCLVTENLCSSRYFQVDRDTTKLAYMRAAMESLANIHGINFSFMKSLGGKEALLKEFPTIKEQLLTKNKKLRKEVEVYVLPFLLYMAKIKPDISQQLQVLSKFHKFLFRVYSDLQDKTELMKLKTLVHGDAKLDNFLFKKESWGQDDEKYSAMLIDWQGCGFDLVSNDLMWCLYGFIKNLPETGEMIHGFVEYSLVTYWDALKKVLKAFGDKCSDFSLPEDSEWAAELIKEGFTLEFMKNAIIRPVLCLKNKELLFEWFQKVSQGQDEPPPPESEIFKSESYSSFIYLFFKIGTEVNVFSHLGKVLFTQMKEAMFSDDPDKESDQEDEEEQNVTMEKQNGSSCPALEDSVVPPGNVPEGGEVAGDAPEGDGVAGALCSLLAHLTASLETVKELKDLQVEELKGRQVKELKGQQVKELKGPQVEEQHAHLLQECKEVLAQMHSISPDLFPVLKQEVPATVTSMYGKTYKLKKV